MGRRRFEACASTCRGRYLGYATAPVGSYASSRTACRRSSASVGRDERYRFTNAAYSDWFGHSPNRRKGLHIREVLGDALYEKVRLRIEAALSGEEQVFEIERAFTDGTKKYLQVRSIPDVQGESDDGDVLGFYVLASDVTEARLERQALGESEERLRRLVETTKFIPWEADANTRQFTYVGPRAEEILGYPADQWYEDGFWVRHIASPRSAYAT